MPNYSHGRFTIFSEMCNSDTTDHATLPLPLQDVLATWGVQVAGLMP
jgi:hypothetical protein